MKNLSVPKHSILASLEVKFIYKAIPDAEGLHVKNISFPDTKSYSKQHYL